jgi:hypothetical protein
MQQVCLELVEEDSRLIFMSINVHFLASREIYIPSVKKTEVQEIYFEQAWQTSTKETMTIKSSDNPIQAYTDWVLARNLTETINIYEEDDYFCDNPIGTKIHNYSEEHIEVFENWLSLCKENGYSVIIECW